MVTVMLLGFWLRCVPLAQNRAMEDEALYGYWGLQIASGADSMLDREPVDKPPLFPYVLALTFGVLAPVNSQARGSSLCTVSHIVGGPLTCTTPSCRAETAQIEMASRLPSLFSSTAAIALLYSLGRRLYRSAATGLFAALLLALSPFAALFGPTAFVDPMLSTWVLASLLAAATGRMGLAGLAAGLAAATKQQGLLFLPLVVAIGILERSRRDGSGDSAPHAGCRLSRQRFGWTRWGLFALGLAVAIGPVIAWDQARAQRPGFFEQSIISYGGLRFATLSQLGDRAGGWLRLLGSFWGSRWLNGLLLGVLLALAASAAITSYRHAHASLPCSTGMQPAPPSRSVSFAIVLFVVLFLLAHWLLQIQIWDRYLLCILPLVALLLARALVAVEKVFLGRRRCALYLPGMSLLLVAGMAGPMVASLQDRVAVGGDHGAYDGIEDLAAYAREQLPAGSVLYDHWLGYHYRFYLYGARLHIHWYPDLPDLAEDAVAYRREPRYVAFPSWQQDAPAVQALAEAGVSLAPVYNTRRRDGSISFRLYRLVGP